MATQDERLAAIATAAATLLRKTPYHAVRAGDVAAAVQLPGETGRSAVWLYNEVRNRRVLVALAAADAWRDYADQAPWSPPGQLTSVTAARATAVAALGMIVAFHRAEQPLMTQVGYGIGDISTAEKRHLATGGDLAVPSWPDSYLAASRPAPGDAGAMSSPTSSPPSCARARSPSPTWRRRASRRARPGSPTSPSGPA